MANKFTEPEWTTPQEYCPPQGAFSAAGPTPFLLTGVFIRLLQYHFSDSSNIEEPLLKGYIWSPSPKGCIGTTITTEDGTALEMPPSRLLIKSSYSPIGPEIQKLPALLVKREPFVGERVTFQDSTIAGFNKKGIHEGRKKVINIIGSHSIICKGGLGAEADLLGQEVYFRMLHYQGVIKEDFELGHLFTHGVSEVKQRTDESQSTYYTVIKIDWAYVYRWLVVQEAPVMKRIAFNYS